jgi:hypothetical protein
MPPGSASRYFASAVGQQLKYRRAARRHCRQDPPQRRGLCGLAGKVQFDQGVGVVHVEIVRPTPLPALRRTAD